jgi:hypothetical protein
MLEANALGRHPSAGSGAEHSSRDPEATSNIADSTLASGGGIVGALDRAFAN